MKIVYCFKQFIFLALVSTLLFACNNENGKHVVVPDTDLPVMTLIVSEDEPAAEIYLKLKATEVETPRIEIDLGDGRFQLLKDVKPVRTDYYPLKGKTIRIKGKIEELDCDNNDLSLIDVSQNVVLKYLFCANNSLSTLDLSKNVALQKLYCAGNRISQLDFSTNSLINKIVCNRNNLEKENMIKLAHSLPQANPKNKEEAPAIYLRSDIEAEGNKVSDEDIAIIKKKNWRLYFFDKHGSSYER